MVTKKENQYLLRGRDAESPQDRGSVEELSKKVSRKHTKFSVSTATAGKQEIEEPVRINSGI